MVEGPHSGRSLEWWELDSGNYANITLIHVSEFLRFTQKHDLQENLPLSAMLFPLHSHVFFTAWIYGHGWVYWLLRDICNCYVFLTIYIYYYVIMCVCFVPMICYASVIESTSVKLRISSPMEYHGSPFCLPQNRWLSFKFMQVHTSQIYTSQAMIGDFSGWIWPWPHCDVRSLSSQLWHWVKVSSLSSSSLDGMMVMVGSHDGS